MFIIIRTSKTYELNMWALWTFIQYSFLIIAFPHVISTICYCSIFYRGMFFRLLWLVANPLATVRRSTK